MVLPSHGEPFRDHRRWVDETIAHHAERCEQILACLDERSMNAHEMVACLWTRKLEPIHHHFAVFEVMAHLEYMQRQGRVRSTEESGELQWFAGSYTGNSSTVGI
jgi:hypothetical protein